MKLALLSDIHANIHALRACLDKARAQGCDQFVFLGDLVGYGGDPVAVLDTIMPLAEKGATVVLGNHDAMALQPPAQTEVLGEASADWTHRQLRPEHLEFLAQLPLTDCHESCFFVHASADEPAQWRYVTHERQASASLRAATATYAATRHVFCGHVHHQTLYYEGANRHLMPFSPTAGVSIPVAAHRAWLATVGSVGQPRDGRNAAMFAIFDTKQHRLNFQRVPYDHDAAAQSILKAGLPEFFAQRLAHGQ